MATELDFELKAGDDLVLECTLKDDRGNVLPLSGVSLKWGFSRMRADGSHAATPVVEKTIGDGITVVDAGAGRYNIVIDSADTASRRGDWYHECEALDSNGKRATALYGVMTVVPDLVDN